MLHASKKFGENRLSFYVVLLTNEHEYTPAIITGESKTKATPTRVQFIFDWLYMTYRTNNKEHM